jgi:transcriptional regulator with XRE-family HTH domain
MLELRLKEIRKQKGITQQMLAEKIGISKQRLSNYENGKRRLPADIAILISKELNIPVEELYSPKKEKESKSA